MQWFKFYAQDWLTDIKIMSLLPTDRLLFITLLCLAAASDEPGVVKGCDEDTIIMMTHLGIDEAVESRGFLKRLASKGIISVSENGDVFLVNFKKRQESYMTNAERQAKFRAKNKEISNSNAIVTEPRYESNARIEQNRIEEIPSDEDTTPLEERQPQTLEEFMESKGYHRDSNVDSDGSISEWWQDENGTKLRKGEVTALQGAYKRSQGVSTDRRQPPQDDQTTRFLEFYKKEVKSRFGKEPVADSKTKVILRKGLIEKYPKEQVNQFVRWFLDNEKIERKWKFSLESLASTKFMNEFLSQ